MEGQVGVGEEEACTQRLETSSDPGSQGVFKPPSTLPHPHILLGGSQHSSHTYQPWMDSRSPHSTGLDSNTHYSAMERSGVTIAISLENLGKNVGGK